ncbi:MAG: hypothetical protein QM537_03920 [Candidatus Symbiobacter sp.]|nr:hypothetical protein [Candidatus Symbiobacter sp.]
MTLGLVILGLVWAGQRVQAASNQALNQAAANQAVSNQALNQAAPPMAASKQMVAASDIGAAPDLDAGPDASKTGDAAPPVVTLYTSASAESLKDFVADLRDATGLQLKIRTARDAEILANLLHRNPDEATDLVLIASAGLLDRGRRAGLWQELPEAARAVIDQAATPHDAKNYWLGVARYAYGLAYVTPPAHEITRYEDLANPEWHGRVCTPNLAEASERAFLSSRLAHEGSDRMSQFFIGLAANDALIANADGLGAARYSSHLTAEERLTKGLLSGGCDVALVTSRTLARLTAKLPNNGASEAGLPRQFAHLRLMWPESDIGVATDVIGLAISQLSPKTEPHQQAITQAIAYFLSERGQLQLADALYAYPIRPGVPLANEVARWGPFRADGLGLDRLLAGFDSLIDLIEPLTWH